MMPSFIIPVLRNTVIARIHPIIENTYLIRLKNKSRNLRFYIFLTNLFGSSCYHPVFKHINKQSTGIPANGI